MSTVKLYGITALFGTFLGTNIKFSQDLTALFKAISEFASFGSYTVCTSTAVSEVKMLQYRQCVSNVVIVSGLVWFIATPCPWCAALSSVMVCLAH